MPPPRCGKVFSSVLGWRSANDNTSLLYVPAPSVFSTVPVVIRAAEIKRACWYYCLDEERVDDDALFSVACPNGILLHSFAHVQFDHRC